MIDKVVLTAVPLVFKKTRGKARWFLVKQSEDSEWEIPKTLVRRGESSVRAAIRVMAEQGGMQAKVLEEVGRSGGAVKIKGRTVSQKYLYYLMVFKDGGEVIGYQDNNWMEYTKAVKELATKRDEAMLKEAQRMYRNLEKENKKAGMFHLKKINL